MRKKRRLKLMAVMIALCMVICYMPSASAQGASGSSDAKYDEGYEISSVLSQFQFFLSGSVTMGGGGHTVGAVVVGDTMQLSNTFGDAAIVPSYIKKLETGTFGNAWHGKYPDKSNIVYYGTGGENQDQNIWIHNPDYINTKEAFDALKKESSDLAEASDSIQAQDGVVTIDCTGDDDVYVTMDYATFINASQINVKVDDVDWFKDHICSVSFTGVNEAEVEFNCTGKIALNGNGIVNQLKNMTGSDEEYSSQLNVGGMNLLWNFPDATGTIKAPGLGGHMVAPQATVDLQWNYEGGVIAANITGDAQGHFYPMSRTLKVEKLEEEEPDEVTATGTFSKKAVTGGDELPGATLSLTYRGEGSLADVTSKSGPKITINNKSKTIVWKSGTEPEVLEGLPAGIYMLAETSAPAGYKYADTIIFKVDQDGKIYKGTYNGKTITYEKEPSETIEMIDEAKAGSFTVKGTKKITGKAPKETYNFVVKEGNKTVATGKVTGAGEIVFTEIKYGPSDIGKHTYTVTEEAGSTEGMTYDDTAFTVIVTVQDVKFEMEDGKIKYDENGNPIEIPDLTVTSQYEGGKDIVFTNVFEEEEEPQTAKATFRKVTEEDGTYSELPGATLKLTYDEGTSDLSGVEKVSGSDITKSKDNKSITWTSGEEATVLDKLPAGEYTLHEEGAPEGYQYASDVKFMVDEDGNLYEWSEQEKAYSKEPTSVLTMVDEAEETKEPEDKTAKATFRKVTEEDGTYSELPGATLKLTYDEGTSDLSGVEKVSGSDITKSKDNKSITWTSGEEATVLDKLPAGEYTLHEEGAPEGYQYASDVKFMVDEDGNLYEWSEQEKAYSKEPTSVLTMVDEAEEIDEPSSEEDSSEEDSSDEPSSEEDSSEEDSSDEPSSEEDSSEEDNSTTEAEKGNLLIVVYDEETGDIVPGAEVVVVDPSGDVQKYVTDEEGKITVNDTEVGTHGITVSKVPDGYTVTEGYTAFAEVEAGKTAVHEVYIIPRKDTTSSEDTTEPSTNTSQTQTGDAFNVIIPIVMIAISIIGIVVIVVRRKKH